MSSEFEIVRLPVFGEGSMEDLIDTVELFVLRNHFPVKKDRAMSMQDVDQIRSVAPVIDALNKLRLIAHALEGVQERGDLH